MVYIPNLTELLYHRLVVAPPFPSHHLLIRIRPRLEDTVTFVAVVIIWDVFTSALGHFSRRKPSPVSRYAPIYGHHPV